MYNESLLTRKSYGKERVRYLLNPHITDNSIGPGRQTVLVLASDNLDRCLGGRDWVFYQSGSSKYPNSSLS